MGITRRMRVVIVAAGVMATAGAARGGDGGRDVWVNGIRMSADQILLLETAFGFCVQDGAYRYDPVSGDFRALGLSTLPGPAADSRHAHAGDRADAATTYR